MWSLLDTAILCKPVDNRAASKKHILYQHYHNYDVSGKSIEFAPVESPHVETVVKLVRKTPDAYIDITIDMDELDFTASEAKATYQEIKDYIFEQYGVKFSSLYIAQVKQKHGTIERANYNTSKSENAKQPKCPPEKEKLIEEALRHFKRIS